MRLSQALKDKKMDVRLRDKFLSSEQLEQKEVDKYVKSLEDLLNNKSGKVDFFYNFPA